MRFFAFTAFRLRMTMPHLYCDGLLGLRRRKDRHPKQGLAGRAQRMRSPSRDRQHIASPNLLLLTRDPRYCTAVDNVDNLIPLVAVLILIVITVFLDVRADKSCAFPHDGLYMPQRCLTFNIQ